jgi:heme/copper-type cytochrome/quinol oxidase subunit 2
MRQRTRNILWFLIFANTVIFWYCIYQSYVTEYESEVVSEYDINIAYLIAVIISVVTIILLIYLHIKDNLNNKKKSLVKFSVFLFGTPIALIFVKIYFKFFYMLPISYITDTKGTFEMEKSRNYFKAKNMKTGANKKFVLWLVDSDNIRNFIN